MAELNWLRHFYFAAREGGFTRAAEALRVAQPAISKAVKQLEEQLGFPLFERRGRNVVLTRRGGDVFRHCQVIFDQVARIDGLTPDPAAPLRGSLHLGAAEGLAAELCPDVLQAFHRRHPELLLSLTTGTAADLCARVRERRLEACLLLHAPRLPTDLRVQRSYPIRHKLVIAASHHRDPAVRANFIGSREIDDPSTRSFPTLRRLQRDLPHAAIAISSNCLSTHKRLVLAGAGVSVLPLFMVARELRRGQLRSLYDRERFQWPARLITLRTAHPSAALTALLPILDTALSAAG